jgi:hypothetical protein
MQINVKVDVSREVLENIVVTALEGGSNYWYCIGEEAINRINSVAPRTNDSSFSERLIKAVFDYGVIVPIHDVEDTDGEPIGELNVKTFEERLELCASEALWALQEEIDERGDAGSSDVVFQYLALGDYIYG